MLVAVWSPSLVCNEKKRCGRMERCRQILLAPLCVSFVYSFRTVCPLRTTRFLRHSAATSLHTVEHHVYVHVL